MRAHQLPNRSWIASGGNINDLSDSHRSKCYGSGRQLAHSRRRQYRRSNANGHAKPDTHRHLRGGLHDGYEHGHANPRGGTDIGAHCDDCTTDIVLPFPVNVYGAPVSVATVGSNGDLQLTASPSEKLFFVLDQCVPVNPDPASHGPFLNTLFPYYADLVTDESVGPCPDCGILTQTLGTAPNRQFVIRWKTNYFNSPPGPAQAEFEVRRTEGSNMLSVIYGVTGDNGLTGTVSGIQQDLNVFTSFSCDEATLIPGLRVDYIPTGCSTPTPTPTARSPTATPTPTATATATPTATRHIRDQQQQPPVLQPQPQLPHLLRLPRQHRPPNSYIYSDAKTYVYTNANSDTDAQHHTKA